MSGGPFEAIIMAGGKGERLAPYTTVLPKPLMPLGDAPVLEYLLRKLHSHGIRRVCLAVNHLRHLIQAFFGDGRGMGLDIRYAVEDEPLGTCGPVAQVLDAMSEHFLLLNGDLVTDLDMADLRARHARTGASATVAVKPYTSQLEFGVLDLDAEDRVLAIREKPRTEYLVSMGIYALSRERIRPHVRPGVAMDMPDLLQSLIAVQDSVLAYRADCQWLDIGKPDDYRQAQAMVEAKREYDATG
jgi:NDP-sugar pyrophosphorylase family protein